MATNPLRWLFTNNRANGDRVEYFRHLDGTCVAVVNAQLEMVGHEDGSPYPVPIFDRLEIDGGPAADEILDELTDVVHDALRGFDWEEPMRYRGSL